MGIREKEKCDTFNIKQHRKQCYSQHKGNYLAFCNICIIHKTVTCLTDDWVRLSAKCTNKKNSISDVFAKNTAIKFNDKI